MQIIMFLLALLALNKPDDGDPPKGDPPPKDPPNDDPPPKTFSQDDVNRIAAREKEQGRQAAAQSLADDLGVSLEEAKTIIKEHRDRSEAEKSEAQRAKEAADREKAEAAEEKKAAARERHETKVERRLIRAGVPDDEEGLKRVMRMVTVEVGASDDDLQAEIDSIKTQFPTLFGTGEGGGGRGRAPSGDPPGSPPKPKGGESRYARGVERAKARSGRKTT